MEWEVWQPTPGLPEIYLVDIDGTVALLAGRNPYDERKVGSDRLNQPIADILFDLMRSGRELIFVTGRTEGCAVETRAWLQDQGFQFVDVFHRAKADGRVDATVKYELFNRHIRGKYNVRAVFDDRQQVVDMWRAIGLPVLQVAPGDF
ncbi:hypothetical protein [Psychromicrobium lacuslunae]|uniref:phosphatase domain-containing protein n=1 Tax=Psychromicrobium lacuslunae TaxID=1618207 RepID=UPI000698E893|nr:hypothetical protein [Psychromicrobium lacuslunae]